MNGFCRIAGGCIGVLLVEILVAGGLQHVQAGGRPVFPVDQRKQPLSVVWPALPPAAQRPISPPVFVDRGPPMSERPFAEPFIDRGPSIADRPLAPIGGGR